MGTTSHSHIRTALIFTRTTDPVVKNEVKIRITPFAPTTHTPKTTAAIFNVYLNKFSVVNQHLYSFLSFPASFSHSGSLRDASQNLSIEYRDIAVTMLPPNHRLWSGEALNTQLGNHLLMGQKPYCSGGTE